MNILTPLFLISLELLNVPYIFGGNDPSRGLDCSGFIQLNLRKMGIIRDNVDRTAQDLYNLLEAGEYRSQLGPDSLLFFGESRYKISHVEMAVNDTMMIGAAGGSKNCTTVKEAKELDARVKFSQIKRRSDMVACIKLTY